MDIKRTIAFSGRDLKAISITGKASQDDSPTTRTVQPWRYTTENNIEYFLCFGLGDENAEYQYNLEDINEIQLLDETYKAFPGKKIYV